MMTGGLHIRPLWAAAIAVPLVVSCTGRGPDRPGIEPPDAPVPIVMSPDRVTRGMHELDYDILKDRHFGVFAAYTGEELFGSSSVVGDYMSNHEFSEGTGGVWSGLPSVYWPPVSTSRLSFFAYAPYDGRQEQLRFDTSVPGQFSIWYSPSTTDIAGQLDLCIVDAARTMDKTYADAPVRLSFEHCLTKVAFYARYKGTPPQGYTIRVDEIKLKHVIGRKTLTYDLHPDDDIAYIWSPDYIAVSGDYSDYRLLRTDEYQHLANTDLPSADGEYVRLQLINGSLYLLPQALSDASVDITFSFNEGDKICAQFSRSIALPSVPVWGGGNTVNYKITIDVGVSNQIEIVGEDGGKIAVEDWKPSGGSHGDTNIE